MGARARGRAVLVPRKNRTFILKWWNETEVQNNNPPGKKPLAPTKANTVWSTFESGDNYVHQVLVLRIILAGCETWSIKDSHFTQMALPFHNRYARSMCGLNFSDNTGCTRCLTAMCDEKDWVYPRSTRLSPINSYSFFIAMLEWSHHDQNSKLSLIKLRGLDQRDENDSWKEKTHTVNMEKYTRKSWSYKKGSGRRLRGIKLRSRGNAVIEHSLDLPKESFRFKPRHQYSHDRVSFTNVY